jgi:hypothetical protein
MTKNERCDPSGLASRYDPQLIAFRQECSVMTLVECLCVGLVQPLDTSREPNLGRLDQKVVMIRHQDPGVQNPAPIDDDAGQQIQETATIGVIAEDVATLVATARDIPDGTR